LAPEVQLVHVASVYALSAGTPGVEPVDVIDAIGDGDEDFLDMVLEGWWRAGGRTVFAARAEDLTSVIDAAMRGEVTWGNEARDRLGLSYERLRDPIDVVLLRYRVNEVPRAEGLRERRPIVAPTAIDSGLREAFCPVGQVATEGRCVDLAARLESPVREVLHPRPLLSARHVLGHGQITSTIAGMFDARACHLEWIRDEMGPKDFAMETDADLAA
jgi:hypothetical protein